MKITQNVQKNESYVPFFFRMANDAIKFCDLMDGKASVDSIMNYVISI